MTSPVSGVRCYRTADVFFGNSDAETERSREIKSRELEIFDRHGYLVDGLILSRKFPSIGWEMAGYDMSCIMHDAENEDEAFPSK